MDAMTMAFPIRDDPKVIAFLQPGDRIEARSSSTATTTCSKRVLTKGFVPDADAVRRLRHHARAQQGRRDRRRDPRLHAHRSNRRRAVKLSQFRGQPVAVTFVYSRCPIATACPLTVARFSKIDAGLKKDNFGQLLCVTVDPENDTPAVLKEYADAVGADPKRWKFLTGDPQAVARVAESFGVLYYPDKAQIVHAQAVAIVDPDGKLADRLLRRAVGAGTRAPGPGESEERMKSDPASRRAGVWRDRGPRVWPCTRPAEHPSETFMQYCAKCHGEDGKAQTPSGRSSRPGISPTRSFRASETDEDLIEAVTEGKDDMPPFGKKLTPEQIQSLVKYDVRGFAPKK